MPKIDLKRRHVPELGALRATAYICTTIERPDPATVSTIVTRPDVYRCHAKVRPIATEDILNYKAVFDSAKAPTVEILVRVPPDVKIDLNHWVFVVERFAEYWCRVQGAEDMGGAGRWLRLLCTKEAIRDIRADPVTQPQHPAWTRPEEAPLPFDDGF